MSVGSASILRRKLCSTSLASDVAPGRSKPPASSPGAEGPRQFDQCEWVAARLRHDSVTHLLIHRPRHHSVQQGTGIGVAEGSHSQFV